MKLHAIKDRARLTEWFTRVHQQGDDIYPLTIAVYKGLTKYRSLDQNALAWAWYKDIADHRGDMTVDEVHRECKLIFGIPILRAEHPEFRDMYDCRLKHIPYAEKLEAMRWISVSSIFTTKQMTAYLDDISRHYAEQGLYLEGRE